jgi:hypothetical protein
MRMGPAGFLMLLEEPIKEFIGAGTGLDLEARDKHQDVFPLRPEQRKELFEEQRKKSAENAHEYRVEQLMETEGLSKGEADEKVRQDWDRSHKEAWESKHPVVIPSRPPKKSWWKRIFD